MTTRRRQGPVRAVIRWTQGFVPDSVLWPLIFATIGLSITLNVVIVGFFGVYPIPDLLHPASAASLGEALSKMSDASRTGYLQTCFLDVIYPLTYGAALSGALARLQPRTRRMAWMPWVPIVGCSFDLVENTFLVLLVSGTVPPTNPWLIPAASANTMKWICADFTMITLATLLLWNGQRRWKAWRLEQADTAHASEPGASK